VAVSANLFANFLDQAASGNINWASDSIKMALLTSSASPNLATWVHYSDLTNEVAAGGGYSTGGVALGTKTHTVTAANSWGTSRANTTSQNVGDIVKPASSNGYIYECVVAGTTGSSLPTYPTQQGNTVTDGTVTWSCIGESITQWSSAAAQWTSATISAQYGVIYDAQSGTGTTEPLICLINFGSTVTSTSGNFTVTPATNGWFWLAPQ